jgi:hypothetical protein
VWIGVGRRADRKSNSEHEQQKQQAAAAGRQVADKNYNEAFVTNK